MGWESFHSIWDDPVDPPPGDQAEPKKAKSKKKASWWEEFHDEDLVADYYGDLDRYSYKSSFDDSSKSWYQQSNFKYKRYEDYSPSQLFRSAIGFKSSYAGDNDARNKAIRALRTLTRNANTIVDAAKKINYTVQFSRGVDSNSGDIDLTGGKNQIVYVSADDLIQTKTPEEEDAVIDALTGFTLLRVQISQSVANDVIEQINKVSARGLAHTAGKQIYATAKAAKTPTELAKQLSAEFVDQYMAGVLAKSILTRLARRAVVTDWGGFAPYFARHAKKFSALADKLAAAEPSVENFAAKISYNMAAAEDEIKLDEPIAEIVDKHLGSELAQEEILPACIALMEDLRKHLVTTLPQPAGELESKLCEGLQPIIEKQQDAGRGLAEKEKLVGAHMKELAQLLDRIEETSDSAAGQFDKASTDCYQVNEEFAQIKYAEKFLEAIASIAEQYKQIAEQGLDENAATYAKSQLRTNLSHFYEQFDYLKAHGLPDDIIAESKHADKTGNEKLGALEADLREMIKQSREILNERANNLKTELKNRLSSSLAGLDGWEKTVQELIEQATALQNKLEAAREASDDMLTQPAEALRYGIAELEHKRQEIASVRELRSTANRSQTKPAKVSATLSRLQKNFYDSHLTDIRSAVERMRSEANGAATRQFLKAAINGQEDFVAAVGTETELARDHWHENAINNFVAREQLTKNTFQAVATRTANQDLLSLLEAQFAEKECDFPTSMSAVNNLGDDAKQQLDGIAKSLGMSLQELLNMVASANEASESAKYDTKNAQDLGELLRDALLQQMGELSSVDEQLFGQAVQAKSNILDLSAISQVNDEASNAAEEEYVAYIGKDANNAKPKVRVIPARITPHERSIAKRIVNANKMAIDRIKNALCFQGTKRTGEVHGLLSGDLDEGSLHKLRYDCEHIWSQKNIARLPDVAVGILVDQSGSMSGEKIRQAREMCIILAEAVRKIEGMHLHVYGHSANMHNGADLTMFEHYSSYGPADQADLGGLGAIEAFSNNYDGYAIKEAAKMLAKDPAKRKYLFVLSDGLPHGNGYCGDEARKHVTSVCSFVRNRLKIPTYAFAVGVSSAERPYFEGQYDKNKVIFLSTVQKCLPQIVRFLHSTIQKEKNLVSADAD